MCVVCTDNSAVSRFLLCFLSLVGQFKWPTFISLNVEDNMLPELGEQFQFLVGLLDDDLHATMNLDLDYMVFA